MSGSILTNASATIALQTLRTTNRELQTINNQISTGQKVATAKDSAAVFAIAQVTRSDVSGFEAITESLSLGSATVAVASNAATQIGDLLNDIKQKVVAAQESNVDRQALQNEIDSLSGQVQSVVDAAQFNGRNLIDGSTASIDVLASLDRDATGAVSSSSITVAGQNLSTAAGAVRGALTGSTGATTNADDATFTLDAGFTNDGSNVLTIDSTNLVAGDQITVNIDDQSVSFTVTADDLAATTPNAAIATGLRDAVLGLGIEGLVIDFDAGTEDTLDFGNDGAGAVDRTVSASVTSVGSGGLAALSSIDVVTSPGTALADIESLIQTTVDAQASFGTSEKRLELQNDFVSDLIDTFEAGVGALVDADLEEASARLQALQVQQQLGTQALSIANQQPQNLLGLFR